MQGLQRLPVEDVLPTRCCPAHVGDYAAGILAEPNVRQLHLGAYRGTPDSPAPTSARQRVSGPVGYLGGLGFGDRVQGPATGFMPAFGRV